MYPVKLGFGEALNRIRRLLTNGHNAEALVTTVFTIEKTLRRTLKQLIISAGFSSPKAEKLLKFHQGLFRLIEAWEIYDPQERKLSQILSSNDLRTIKTAAEMRNDLVHGERAFDLNYCTSVANSAIQALEQIKARLDQEYGYSGWVRMRHRCFSKLHVDPKVNCPTPGCSVRAAAARAEPSVRR